MSAQISSPYYLTGGRFFPNASNVATAPWGNILAAFSSPVINTSVPIAGYDWTKPYPGNAVSGHSVNLTIAQEMHISEDIVQNATTVLTSVTFSTPADMMADQYQPKAMDSSWYVCRHIFISTKPEAKQAVDGGAGCSFLPATCQADLKTSLTQDWGKNDDTYMCGALTFDAIPRSCLDSFDYSVQVVLDFDKEYLTNSTLASVQVSSLQQLYSWRIGTQYHYPGTAEAYEIAANRTYLVANVWGYSSSVKTENRKTPDVSFACLSSGPAYVPGTPIGNSTSTTTVKVPTSTGSAVADSTTSGVIFTTSTSSAARLRVW